MRHLLICLLALSFMGSSASANTLRSDVEALVKAVGGNRSPTTAGDLKAFEWLKREAEKLTGWQVEEQVFDPDLDFAVQSYKSDFEKLVAAKFKSTDPEYKKWKAFTDGAVAYQESLRGKKGRNLILRKVGSGKSSKDVYVFSAHYDTITHNHETLKITPDESAPGADDNTAAVAAVLELARKFKDLKPVHTIELVFFDFEEAFFLGSRAYAQELKKRGLHGQLINLEMIAWDKPDAGRAKVYLRDNSKDDEKLATMAVSALKGAGLKAEALKNNFDRSDNWPMWAFGHAAVTVSQDWERNFNEKHYHTSQDTVDSVNWSFAEKIYKAMESLMSRL